MTTGKQEHPAAPTTDDGRALGGTKEHLSKPLDAVEEKPRTVADWDTENPTEKQKVLGVTALCLYSWVKKAGFTLPAGGPEALAEGLEKMGLLADELRRGE